MTYDNFDSLTTDFSLMYGLWLLGGNGGFLDEYNGSFNGSYFYKIKFSYQTGWIIFTG